MNQVKRHLIASEFCFFAAAPVARIGPSLQTQISKMQSIAEYRRDKAIIRADREADGEQARADVALVASRAAECGLEITKSEKGPRGIRGLLFQFWRDTFRVGDYWPVTRQVRTADGAVYVADSLAAALERVYEKVGPPKPGPRKHGPRPKGESERKHRPQREGTADRPETSGRRHKNKKHEPRKAPFKPRGTAKGLRAALVATVRRYAANNPGLTADEFSRVLSLLSVEISREI